MFRYLLVLLLAPFSFAAQTEATIHQEFRYQLPNPKLKWTPVAGLPSGLLVIPETAEIWGAPNEAGQYKIPFQASDGTQFTLDLKVNALWNLSLTPPQAAEGMAFSHSQIVAGGTPPYTFSATGLPPGLTISPDGMISGTPTKAGAYSATITASDHQGNTLTLPYGMTVNAIGITTINLPYAESDKPYSQQLTAVGGKPPYTWSLVDAESCAGLEHQHPPGIHPDDIFLGRASFSPFPYNVIPPRPAGDLSPDGRLAIQPPIPYDRSFCVQATDSIGSKAISSLTVVSLEPSDSPLYAALAFTTKEVSVGDPVVPTVLATDGTSPYTATALSLPPGFVFYPDQHIVFGYPQTPGVQTIPIQVTDGAGATVICNSTIRVSPIRVGAASTGTPTYGKSFSQQFYAINAAPPYSWTFALGEYSDQQIPAGLTFTPAGLLSGTPLEAGDFSPSGRVTDAFGNSRSFELVGHVSAGTPQTVHLFSYDTPFLTLNRVSNYDLFIETLVAKPPFTWSVTGALPPGMSQQDDRGALTLWGIPTAAGFYPVTVRMTDAKGNAGIRLIPLRVSTLHNDSLTLPNGVIGAPNQFQLRVDGGSPPYRWSVVSGSSLPPGLALSSAGVLSGVPSQNGSFQFTVVVTDAASDTVSLEFTLQIDGIQIVPPQIAPLL